MRAEGRVRAPELRGFGGWLNTGGRELSLAGLRGRIVLLDFWTSACANCLHVIDELRPLEARYADVLTTIGVHSPKFPHEAEHAAVVAAVQRHDVRHPVLDDPDLTTWRQYAVDAWPTLVLIDPDGYVVATRRGERHAAELATLIDGLVAEHGARIRRGADAYVEPDRVETTLCFPGGIAVTPAGTLLVADAGHHSIVELAADGETLLRRIGSGERGRADGGPGEASFAEPQGVAVLPPAVLPGVDVLVADTANHLIRGVRLDTGEVSTVADLPAALAGTRTVTGPIPRVLSPWDVAWWDDRVAVAAAGVHLLLAVDPPAAAAPPGSTGAHRTGADSSGVDLSGVDLSGVDLSGVDLSGVDLSGVDPTGAAPTGAAAESADPAGERSGGERSGGERSGGERSGGERSGGERSGGERSGGERSGGERSGGERSGGERSGGEGSGGERSGSDPAGASGDGRSGSATVLAGTTVEGLKDGPAPDGWLAQPSGLAPDGRRLWFVDAETSSLRHLEDGRLTTHVGEGLFDYGLVDGPAGQARFQHPLGVTVLPDGTVAVLDTYNGAVRRFDPRTKTVDTLATGLKEPTGAVATNGELIVVESAAHRLTRIPLRPTVEVGRGDVTVTVTFVPPPGEKLDDRYGPSTSLAITGLETGPELTRTFHIGAETRLQVSAQAASCDVDAEHPACHLARRDWELRVTDGAPTSVELVLDAHR